MKALRPVRSAEARPIWERVFRSNDFRTNPFQASMIFCGVFFPTEHGVLAREQFSAVGRASRGLGEMEFLVTATEYFDFWREEKSWRTSWDAYEEYSRVRFETGSSETSLYSPRAEWGVALSADLYAIVAGSAAFVAALQQVYDLAADRRRFATEWPDQDPSGPGIFPEA